MSSINNKVVLPAAFILDLDDVMWHDGRDLRCIGQASRSEFPRYHVPEDYEVIDRLGKALNMKISCPICLGDWDKNNRLKGVVGPTHNPYGWNRKDEIDYEKTAKYFEAAESSPYIDYAYHGLLHGLYDECGRQMNEWEYFAEDENKNRSMLSDEEIELHLDLFDKIYSDWGFKKKINTFCPPCGIPLRDKSDWSEIERLSSLLYKRGVRYIIARWQKGNEFSRINSGVLYMEKNSRFGINCAAYDVDPRYIQSFASEGDESFGDVLGMHWTNFLHFHPENNFNRIDSWVEWFNKQAEVFGVMLSRDMRFTGNQCIYRKNSTLTETKNKITLDITRARLLGFDDLGDEIYVSFKNDFLPTFCEGGEMELYEEKKNFKTYRITAHENIINFTL